MNQEQENERPIDGIVSRAWICERLQRLVTVYEAMVAYGGAMRRAERNELEETIGEEYALETAGNPAYSVAAEDLRELLSEIKNGGGEAWKRGKLPRA